MAEKSMSGLSLVKDDCKAPSVGSCRWSVLAPIEVKAHRRLVYVLSQLEESIERKQRTTI